MIWDSEEKRVARRLRASFSGRGMTGFREILKKGRLLSRIENDEDLHIHNDRCEMIELIVGQKNMDKLIDKLCSAILELLKDA